MDNMEKHYKSTVKTVFLLLIFLLSAGFNVYGQIDKPVLTVLDFRVSQVSEQEALILTDFLSGHLVATAKYRVIDRTQRETILSELQFSYGGCTDESCQLEVGRLLAAQYIVIGSLGRIGSRMILNMSLVEVETGETKNSVSGKYADLDELVDDSETIVARLTGAEVPTVATTPAQPKEPEPAEEPSAMIGGSSGSDDTGMVDVSKDSTSVRTASSSKPKSDARFRFDIGAQLGGAFDAYDTLAWGLYAGGLIPFGEAFGMGIYIDTMAPIDYTEDTDILIGTNFYFGNPESIALGLGAEVSPQLGSAFSTSFIGVTGTLYIAGLSLRVFYTETAFDGVVILLGAGLYF